MIAAAMTTTSATVIQQSYAGLPPPLTSEDVRLSLIAETSTANAAKTARPPRREVGDREVQRPGTYATVYATAKATVWLTGGSGKCTDQRVAGGTVRSMPLRYVDPNKKRGRGYAAVESFARSGPGQFVARHVFWRIDPWLYRVSGGRYPWIGMVTAR